MSKMTNTVKENRANRKPENAITNFMGGISYTLNPLETLKLVSASSIFGEPQYYRDGEFAQKGIKDGVCKVNALFADYMVLSLDAFNGKKTSEVMEKVIDDALNYDFAGTLAWAVELRRDYYMRLNPQVIMVRAAMHPKREEYTKEHPGEFARINATVMARADEPSSQLTYYLYRKGNKNSVPGILKRSWAQRISEMSRRDIYKYRNSGVGLIDTVRICHASSKAIDELMKTGTVEINENDLTWETLRSQGKSWKEILETIHMGHMALLRNLRGIFSEISDREYGMKILEMLKKGVVNGKQFPFRYQSAYTEIAKAHEVHNQIMVLDALEECMDIACENMPHLKGRTMCLSDNSGSAWGSFTSEYGSVTVANIDNLSSVITARNSDEGFVGKFGDKLLVTPIAHRNGVLSAVKPINHSRANDVGGATENGIWLFFEKAIHEKEHWDNIFIYSDMQAGHGGLYGTHEGKRAYCSQGYGVRGKHIDVAKLIDTYRKQVNPKVNVFCVQTAGYNNVLVPENGYRTSILTGWTGKELVYAGAVNALWDEFDAAHQKN